MLIAIAIKMEDGGPLLYIQERWGRDGKKFKAYKFRTMIPDADKKWGMKPAAQNDFRITRIGRLLRATAMDELPQLANIWKGDMSFVGPRALAVDELSPEAPGFHERHSAQPGLTGLAQVEAPRDAPLAEKFEWDMRYLRSRSFWLDLRLIAASVLITLRGRWERRDKKV